MSARRTAAAALALALLAALCCAGCSFDEGGLAASSGERVTPVGDARGERGLLDQRLDRAGDAADGARFDSTRDGPRPEGAPPPDTTRDGGPAPDTTRDTVAPDTTRDTVAPDTTRDSGPPTYIDERFNSGPGVLSAQGGSWSYSGGRANQTTTSINGPTLSGSLPVADYVVDSVVRVHGIQGLANAGEGAGIAARIQPPTGVVGAPAAMYGCIVSPDQNRVYLIESNGSNALYSVRAASGSVTVSLNTPYRILLTVNGTQLACSVPSLGVNLSASDSSISSAGRAGLVTLFAHASWEYLTVRGL